MNQPLDEQNDSPSKWELRKQQLDEARKGLQPGFNLAAPRFASPPGPLARTIPETAQAAIRQGPTLGFLNAFKYNPEAKADPDFIVQDFMRPQDYRYPVLASMAPNLEEWQRAQAAMDARDSDYEAMQARPWVSGFSMFLDPGALGIDIASYGLGHLVTVPLIAGTLGRTQAGIRMGQVLARSPRGAHVLEQSVIGAEAGALSTYLQDAGRKEVDPFHDSDHLGSHMFFNSLIGLALGGTVGYLGYNKTRALEGKYNRAYQATQKAQNPPPDFVGPPEPTPSQRGILSTGKRPDIRMELQEEPKPKKTKEQIKSEAQALKESVELAAPERESLYAGMRSQFRIIGENLIDGKGVFGPIKNALEFVSRPVRKMSATNRLLSSPFGSARLAAVGMARNATEFLGTREGLILPRSAQNRIEDIMNKALDAQIQMYEYYLKANKIEPGKFAAERLAVGKRIYEETKFYEDASTHMLHLDRPSERNFVVEPNVKAAAKVAYDDLYKPLGDLLKDYNIISKDAGIDEVLNYLNREWSTQKLLNDPEGFKNWLADFYDFQNEKLKSILPNYNQEKDFAKLMERDAKRFDRAADEIEKLEKKVDKNLGSQIQKLESEKDLEFERITEKYDNQRDKVTEKYNAAIETGKLPDVKTTKKLLKREIKSARAERDKITKQYDNQISSVDMEIKNARVARDAEIKAIKEGKRDKLIEDEFKSTLKEEGAEFEFESPELVDVIDEVAAEIGQEIDPQIIKGMRKDLVSEKRLEYSIAIDDLKAKRYQIRAEKKRVLDANKQALDKDLTEGTNLLEQEAKLSGKKIKDAEAKEKLFNARKNLELKIIDLKQDKELALKAQKFAQRVSEIQAPVERLEYLQRKYSRAGMVAMVERRAATQQAEKLKQFGATDESLAKMISDAKSKERKKINEAQVVNEARALAEELRADAAMVNERAEKMIPWELRSSKTGKPYSTWDKAEFPEHAYNLADRTYYTILGQEDEIVTNPVLAMLSGTQNAGMFKPRSVKMPDDYAGITNWVERDIRVLMNNFASGVSAPIALTELMQELNQLPIIKQTVKRMQVLDKNIGPVKALDMPDEMVHYTEVPKVLGTMMREEYRMMSKGLSGDELKKLTQQYKNAEKDLSDLDKQIKGVFGNGSNVNSRNAADMIDLVNSGMSTVINNNLVISMMGDTMAPVLQYGFRDYIEKGLKPLLDSAELRALNAKELRQMGIAIKVAQGQVMKNRISGRQTSLKNSVVGRKISNLANRMGNITGANAMQDFTEVATGVLVKTNMLEMAEKIAKGTISNRELTHLAQRSISPEKAKAIYEMYKRHGWSRDGVRGIDPAKMVNPSPADAQAFRWYQNFVNDDVRAIIARPGVGSLPNFAYTPAGKSVLFLKKWFMAATNDLFLPAAQRFDKQALEGFSFLFAMGALQSKIRQLYRSEELDEFSIEGFITEALTNSGILGIYTFGLDAALAAGIIAGNGGARFDPMNGLPSMIAGPGAVGLTERGLNILGRMRKIMTNEDRQFEYKDLNYMMSTAAPFYRWAPVSSVVKPTLKEYFESIGRGEK